LLKTIIALDIIISLYLKSKNTAIKIESVA